MLKILKSKDRGRSKTDWLDSFHSFSFAEYYNPEQMRFGNLRVINEDWVKGGAGFDTHAHRDMEIITYVMSGSLEHKDSLGTGSIITVGDVQRMSAGRGIEHSEFNPKKDVDVHLLQIWILPERKAIEPSYEQKNFSAKRKSGQLTLLVSRDGREDSLHIHQDANLYVLDLDPNQTYTFNIPTGRKLWLQMARGTVIADEQQLEQGDAAAVTEQLTINFKCLEKCEILIFDLQSF